MTPSNNNNDNSSVIQYSNTIHIKRNDETRKVESVLHEKMRLVKSLSVKPERIPLYKAFLVFCKREHIDFSSGVFWALKEFLIRHTPPNPQPTLDRILKLNTPAKPNTICFVPGCRAKSAYVLVLKNYDGQKETFHVCRRHQKWRHPEFKFIVRMTPIR